MNIHRAAHAGFCFGVKRALDIAEQTIRDVGGQKPIYTLGPIIHNPLVVERLAQQGLKVAGDLGEVEDGVLVVRSHGLPLAALSQAKEKSLRVVDATCPFVARSQRLARRLGEEGYQVLIIGEENHPEVLAIQGTVQMESLVIGSAGEVSGLKLGKKVGIISQTTQPLQNFLECVSAVLARVEEAKVFRTICPASTERQKEAWLLAQQVPVMVVIGGRSSANTAHLAESCRLAGARTYLIESAAELQHEWFRGVKDVGVTAGASTPNWLIEEVIGTMEEFKSDQAKEQTGQETPEGMNQNYDQPMPELAQGQTVTARVVQVQPDEVMVDIGYKSEGIIPKREISAIPVESAQDAVKVGDTFPAKVLKINTEEGTVLLSKRRAEEESAWERLKEAKDKNLTLEARVREQVKGGLLVDVGVRGFVPASHVSRGFVKDLSPIVGQTLGFKVLEMDEGRKNVVLSHKLVEEEEMNKAREQVMAKIKKGMIVDGVVKRLTSFGAFVDIGDGVEGLLHVSEMAWHRVGHPSEVLSENDTIKVMVLDIDPASGHISLSLKQTLPDPWTKVTRDFKVDQIVQGEVTRVVDFGAFIKLAEGVEGLAHISQLADHRVEKASDAVQPGQVVPVKILSIDPQAKRISLSIREALPKKPEPPRERPVRQETVLVQDQEDRVTLGDMFGKLFEEHRGEKSE